MLACNDDLSASNLGAFLGGKVIDVGLLEESEREFVDGSLGIVAGKDDLEVDGSSLEVRLAEDGGGVADDGGLELVIVLSEIVELSGDGVEVSKDALVLALLDVEGVSVKVLSNNDDFSLDFEPSRGGVRGKDDGRSDLKGDGGLKDDISSVLEASNKGNINAANWVGNGLAGGVRSDAVSRAVREKGGGRLEASLVEAAGEALKETEASTGDCEVGASAARSFTGRDVGDSSNGKGLEDGDGVEGIVRDSRAVRARAEGEGQRGKTRSSRRRLADNTVIVDNVSLDSLGISKGADDRIVLAETSSSDNNRLVALGTSEVLVDIGGKGKPVPVLITVSKEGSVKVSMRIKDD